MNVSCALLMKVDFIKAAMAVHCIARRFCGSGGGDGNQSINIVRMPHVAFIHVFWFVKGKSIEASMD